MCIRDRLWSCPLLLLITVLEQNGAAAEWAASPTFAQDFQAVFTTTALTQGELETMIPTVWSQIDLNRADEPAADASDEASFSRTCAEVADGVTKIQDLQFTLFTLLLQVNRSAVHKCFGQYLESNRQQELQSQLTLTSPTLACNLFMALLRSLQPWLLQDEFQFSARSLCLDREPELQRLGGTVSHLQKEHPMSADMSRSLVQVGLGGELSRVLCEHHPSDWEPADMYAVALQIYSGVVAREYKQASQQLQSKLSLTSQLRELRNTMAKQLELGGSTEDALKLEVKTLRLLCISIRASVWTKACYFGNPVHLHNVLNSCTRLTSLLTPLGQSADPNLHAVLSYVPEFWLECLVDMFHALRCLEKPFAVTSTSQLGFKVKPMVHFFVGHFNCTEIVNPEMRDKMLQTLSVLLQYSEYVRIFESDPAICHTLMQELLSSFNSRFWIPITSILLRIFQGTGFCQELCDKNDTSSAVLQRHFQTALTEASRDTDSSTLNEFLNLVFNNLNWTVTEFLVALKEIETAAKSRLSTDLRELQRKCNITFELATFLFRVIEVLTHTNPELFLQSDDVALSRICEMILHVVNQVTVGKHSVLFEAIVQLKLKGLDKLSRSGILDPVVGTTINLHYASQVCSSTHLALDSINMTTESAGHFFATKLASFDSFTFDNFEYLSNFACCRAIQRKTHYKESQVAETFACLREAAVRRHLAQRQEEEMPEEFMDPISCALMENPVTLPSSGKVVDHSTIARHLLSDSTDPFSRAKLLIEDVIPHDELRTRIEKWKREQSK
eukprot:TRINITY_DN2029_c0_g1_i1.p1 TRINITY_DN2029_c0_g1~~TRINITY_DN2029_c0_g1_i1.p1  ORF type:complete len:787 (+),score=174.81 TRINITY_DN2029_c0_g1_i1:124-2484(+)